MSREAALNDFTITVDGIGVFRFGRRTMRDEIRIQVEYARMIEGVEPTAWLSAVCGWLATLRVLSVDVPEGWDLDALDPLDDGVYARLLKVYTALAEKERSFRPGNGKESASGGAGTSRDGGVLVPQEIRPDGDGSALS